MRHFFPCAQDGTPYNPQILFCIILPCSLHVKHVCMSPENSSTPPFFTIFRCYVISLFSYPLYFSIILQYSKLSSKSLAIISENMKCFALLLLGLVRKNKLSSLASELKIH